MLQVIVVFIDIYYLEKIGTVNRFHIHNETFLKIIRKKYWILKKFYYLCNRNNNNRKVMKSRATEIEQLKRTYQEGTEVLGAILHKLNTLNETIQSDKDIALCYYKTHNEDGTQSWIKKMEAIPVPFKYISNIYMGNVTLTAQGMEWFKKEYNRTLYTTDLVVFSPANAGAIMDMILWHYCLDK